MIIDATNRGTVARLVNHSCEPNCKIEKWTVSGQSRMGLFAGDRDIAIGEELTYDYRFEYVEFTNSQCCRADVVNSPYSMKNVQTCYCGTPSCRGILGPKNRSQERELAQKPQESSGVLADTRRKLGRLFAPSAKANHAALVSKQRRRATIEVFSGPAATQKRVTSTSTGGSTLVDKENMTGKMRLRRSSSVDSLPVSQRRGIVKKSPVKGKKRRYTFDALARAASNTKDHVGKIRNNASLRSSSRLKLSEDNKIEADATTMLEARPTTSSSIRSAATTLKRNVVNSVRGPTRQKAMRTYGKRGSLGGNGKSVRVVSKSDD